MSIMRNRVTMTLVVGAVAVLVATAIADSRPPVAPADASRAAAAAVTTAGGGKATAVDRDTERGATWEVEVTRPDGTRLDVLLDAQFKTIDVGPERETTEKPAPVAKAEAGDAEVPVPATDAERAGQAALEAVGGGTVHDVDREVEAGATWEVEIMKADGSQVDVLLDAQFKVISAGGEQEPNEGADDQSDDRD